MTSEERNYQRLKSITNSTLVTNNNISMKSCTNTNDPKIIKARESFDRKNLIIVNIMKN